VRICLAHSGQLTLRLAATQIKGRRAHGVNLNKKATKEKCSSRQMKLDGLG